ncbi:hypothetical protein [Spirillospora sp. CA-294931]|uniref:hypothetical protein n=1 Tax=Spirillospora sp. CA-294931 TaxID=3240042 RepID=UPI003D91E2F5
MPQAPGPAGPSVVLGLRARQWMVVAIVLGCCYLAASAAALSGAWATLNRDPTTAEIERAANAEVARRWEAWPAGRIFPDRLPYAPDKGSSELATRVGIVQDTSCEAAVDPELATLLLRHGCRAVLRATYADQLQGVVVTVGVVAFPDAWKADKALKEIPVERASDTKPGVQAAVRAAPFPGTASARFNDAARQDRGQDRGGPYVLLTASGQSDGRPAAVLEKERPGEPFSLAPQLARTIARTLSTQALPDCSSSEWRC